MRKELVRLADGSLLFDTKTDTTGIDTLGSSLKAAIKGLGIAKAAQEIEQLGSTFETSFAKASTLFGDVSVDTQNLNEKIREMSNTSGTAASELNDSLYQAMSAGVPVTRDMAECIEAVDVANKLSIGGYTDASTAMGALTTAINAYKMNASDAESISDKLLTVQNKGVTTVDELASSMGKAIATGSNYGVNLDNLCAAYISLTKNGINTAEGTTYLNSLIKELGDSGSTAAGILKDQTGMSFGQLMSAGYSLGDVLKIVSDSCNGDTEAFANLWSSAEGGMAASAIVSQGTDTFNESLDSLANSAGTTEDAYNTMSDTFQRKTDMLKQSASNLAIELFQNVEPALELIVQGLQWCADNMNIIMAIVVPLTAAFVGLKAGMMLQGVVNSFQEAQVALSLFKLTTEGTAAAEALLNGTLSIGEGIVAVLTGQMTLAEFATGALTRAWTALNTVMHANAIGVIVAVLALLVAGFIYLWNNCEGFREFWINLWENIKEAVTVAIDAIASFFTETIPNFIQSVIDWFAALPENLAQWGQNVYTTVTTAISDMISSVIEFFAQLPEQIAYWIGYVLGTLVQWGIDLVAWCTTAIPEFIDNVVTFFSELPNKIYEWLIQTILKIYLWQQDLKQKAIEAGKNFLTSVVEFFRELPGKVAEWLLNTIVKVTEWQKNLVEKGKAAAKGLYEAVVNGIKSLPKKIADIGKNIVLGLWNGIKNAWSWLTGKVSDLANSLLSGFKDALGIHSPSRKFKWIGEMCIAGMDEPIEDYNPYDTLNKSIKENAGTMTANFVGSGSYAENISLGIDYEALGSSFAKAMVGLAVNMDGKRVGTLIAPHVDYALGDIATVRT